MRKIAELAPNNVSIMRGIMKIVKEEKETQRLYDLRNSRNAQKIGNQVSVQERPRDKDIPTITTINL